MAGHLILKYEPFATPGDIERNVITKVGGVEATLSNWLTKAKESTKEDGSNFIEVELEAEALGPNGVSLNNTKVEKYLVNVTQVQNVHEY